MELRIDEKTTADDFNFGERQRAHMTANHTTMPGGHCRCFADGFNAGSGEAIRALATNDTLSDAAYLDECAKAFVAARINTFMDSAVPVSDIGQKISNIWAWAYMIAEGGVAERKRRREVGS